MQSNFRDTVKGQCPEFYTLPLDNPHCLCYYVGAAGQQPIRTARPPSVPAALTQSTRASVASVALVIRSVSCAAPPGGTNHMQEATMQYDPIKAGRNWAYVRRVADVSQFAAAMDMRITSSYLSCIERGVKRPSIPVLLRAADYYNVSADYLLGRTERPRG